MKKSPLPATDSDVRMRVKELIKACAAGDLPKVTDLVRSGVPIDFHVFNNSPLFAAVCSGNLPVVEFLVASGANVNLKPKQPLYWTPLISAADNGHLEIVKLLVMHGADVLAHTDPENPATTASYYAVYKNNPDLLKYLRDLEASARRKGERAPIKFEVTEISHQFACIKAPIDAVAREAVLYLGKDFTWTKCDTPQTVAANEPAYALLRSRQSEWVALAAFSLEANSRTTWDWAQVLSERLSCEAALYTNSQDPHVLGYRYWNSGAEIEFYEFDGSSDALDVPDEPVEAITLRYRELVRQGVGSTFRSANAHKWEITNPAAFITFFIAKNKLLIPSIETGTMETTAPLVDDSSFWHDHDLDRFDLIHLKSSKKQKD